MTVNVGRYLSDLGVSMSMAAIHIDVKSGLERHEPDKTKSSQPADPSVNLFEKYATTIDEREQERFCRFDWSIMSFDAQVIFANLAEKEKLKGHHSPEGQAIRTLSRALHGWSSNNLGAGDVVVLCEQAVEDWLKARMKVSEWSAIALIGLIVMAVQRNLLTPTEAERLRRVHEIRSQWPDAAVAAADAESALQNSIEIIEERWG